MNVLKNKIFNYIGIGFAVFVFGVFVGYQLNYGALSSIEGYLFNAAADATSTNATSTNATSTNATSTNATSTNATSTNATSTNATSSNVRSYDNIIFLENFELKSTNVKKGDKVYISLVTTGACNSAASVVFKSESGHSFTVQVKDINTNPYIIIPDSVISSTYSVTDLLLTGLNSNNTTFSKLYSKNGSNSYTFDNVLTILKEDNNESNNVVGNSSKITLNDITFKSSSASVGEKVYFEIQTDVKLNSLKLIFTSSDGKTINVYANNLSLSNPYFEIPSSTISGNYSLTAAILSTNKSSVVYGKNDGDGIKKFDFNYSLEINDETEVSYIYNNEDITSNVLTKLYNAPSGSQITINADSSVLINEDLFNAIKGKDKKLVINYKSNQIIFNGESITDSKTVDITMNVEDISSNDDINKLVSNGIIVNFQDNGNLPGEALIRVKSNDEVDRALNGKVFVYIYNESTDNFSLVAEDVSKTSDGYYEFTISHNSDYLLVNKKLDDKLVASSADVVDFQKSDKVLLLLICGGFAVVGAVVIFMLVLKNKNKKSTKKQSK